MSEAALADRLRKLLAMEVVRVVEDLVARRELLLTVWSRHRARQPFLDAMFSRWRSTEVRHLLLLGEEEIVPLEDFHRELDLLRTYAAYTEDMPMTVAERFDAALPRLAVLGDRAVEALGGAPERPPALGLEPTSVPAPEAPPAAHVAADEAAPLKSVAAGETRSEAPACAPLGPETPP